MPKVVRRRPAIKPPRTPVLGGDALRRKAARQKSQQARRAREKQEAQEAEDSVADAINLNEACGATKEDLKALKDIIGGQVRNAASAIKALELKWAYGHGRPKVAVEHSGKIGLEQLLNQLEDPEQPDA